MVPNEKSQIFTTGTHSREQFSDVVTKRKISKHISDINDTITEDDIRNVQTNFDNVSSIAQSIISRKKESNN
jgi:hypothetical protein